MVFRGMDRDSLSKRGNAPFPLATHAGLRLGKVEHLAWQQVAGNMHFLQLGGNLGIVAFIVKGMQVKQQDSRSDATTQQRGQCDKPICAPGSCDDQQAAIASQIRTGVFEHLPERGFPRRGQRQSAQDLPALPAPGTWGQPVQHFPVDNQAYPSMGAQPMVSQRCCQDDPKFFRGIPATTKLHFGL